MLKIINPQRNAGWNYNCIVLPPSRVAKLRKTHNFTSWQGGVELLEFSDIASGSVKWYTTLENFLTVSESQMYAYPMTQQFQENICLQKDLSIIFLESLFLIVPNETIGMSVNRWMHKLIVVYPYNGLYIYYCAIKRKKLLTYETTWISVKNLTRKGRWTQEYVSMIPFMWNSRQNLVTESRTVVA